MEFGERKVFVNLSEEPRHHIRPNSFFKYFLVTVICWGLQEFFLNISSQFALSVGGTLASQNIGAVTGMMLILTRSPNWDLQFRPLHFLSFIGGMLTSVAVSGFYQLSLLGGEASLISPLLGLYGVIPTTLGLVFLRERLTMKKSLGICFSLLSISILALSDSSENWDGIATSNLPYFCSAFFGWGFAYFLHGIASKTGDFHLLIMQAVAGQTFAIYGLILFKFGAPGLTQFSGGQLLSFLSGFIGIFGELGFFSLSKEGEEASLVAPLTGTYVLIPTVLGLLFLQESFGFLKAAGVLFSVISLVVLGSASNDNV